MILGERIVFGKDCHLKRNVKITAARNAQIVVGGGCVV